MDDDLADAAAGKDIGIPRILIERARDVGRRAGVIDAIDADAKETVGRKVWFSGSDIDGLGL